MFIIDLLKKCNHDKIIEIINENHPIQTEIWPCDTDNFSAEKLSAYSLERSNKINNLISDLLSRNVKFDKDKIIFCLKIKDDLYDPKEEDGPVEFFDVFYASKDAIKNCSNDYNNFDIYSLSFVPWNTLLGYRVCEKSIKEYGVETVIAEFLWEITFYGWEEDDMQEQEKKLADSVKEYEESKENGTLKTHTLDELFNEIGYKDTRTEEERKEDLERAISIQKENSNKIKSFILSEKNKRS